MLAESVVNLRLAIEYLLLNMCVTVRYWSYTWSSAVASGEFTLHLVDRCRGRHHLHCVTCHRSHNRLQSRRRPMSDEPSENIQTGCVRSACRLPRALCRRQRPFGHCVCGDDVVVVVVAVKNRAAALFRKGFPLVLFFCWISREFSDFFSLAAQNMKLGTKCG